MTQPAHEARLAAQAKEYGVYVCGDAPIFFGSARAFNPGDPVPVSTVESGRVSKDQVVQVASKTEAAAAAKKES